MDVNRLRMDDNRTLFSSLFSTEFDMLEKKVWMEKNWTLSLYGVLVYVLFIFLGQEFMKNRKPMDLRRVMAVWNFILAAFSISACTTIIPEFVRLLMNGGGFHRSVCGNVSDISAASMFWGWLFTLSKMMELGDTVFIILRKRTLIFLHWYHHITVLLYTWYSYADMISPARWFIVVNFSIHAMMYTYYGLRAMGVWIPKPIAMSITMLQLSQMVVGVIVNGYAYAMKSGGVDCEVSNYHLQMGFAMYASYFLLFLHFFYKAYFTKSAKSKSYQRHKGPQNNNNETKANGTTTITDHLKRKSTAQQVNGLTHLNGSLQNGNKVH